MAALGVGRLRIVDPDILATHNLDATPGLTPSDVGLPKTAALARRLLDFRPDLAVTWIAESAKSPAACELLHRRSDLLVTCVDDDLPRALAAVVARETLSVHLDIATSVQRAGKGALEISADVRLLLPSQGCAVCVGPMRDVEDTFYALAAPPGALVKGRPPGWSEQRAGSLLSINSIAVGTGVQLWLDLLRGDAAGSVWSRLAWQAGGGVTAETAPVGPRESCAICHAQGTAGE